MIRIQKPKAAPAPLRTRGPAARRRICQHYAQSPGAPPAQFESGIYNHQAVRKVLHTAQHGKCAYCERKLVRTDGDIDHFRPKAAVQQAREAQPRVPGYYWLAYEWNNLLLTCQHCNQFRTAGGAGRGKGSLFPLLNPKQRARRPADDLSREQPLLVNPAEEDPARHLTFRGECIQARTQRGAACIQILGLDDPALEERRNDRLMLLRPLFLLLHAHGTRPGRAAVRRRADLRANVAPSLSDAGEFSAMARAAFEQLSMPTEVKGRRRRKVLTVQPTTTDEPQKSSTLIG